MVFENAILLIWLPIDEVRLTINLRFSNLKRAESKILVEKQIAEDSKMGFGLFDINGNLIKKLIIKFVFSVVPAKLDIRGLKKIIFIISKKPQIIEVKSRTYNLLLVFFETNLRR